MTLTMPLSIMPLAEHRFRLGRQPASAVLSSARLLPVVVALTLSLWLGLPQVVATGAPAATGNADSSAVKDAGDKLLAAWFAAQAQLNTWSADVTQTRRLKSLTQPLVATGKIWVAMPDRFRWQVGDPPQTIALGRPGELQVIYPRLKRAEVYPLDPSKPGPWKDALALLDAGFPKNRQELENRFRLVSVVETNGLMTLRLQPRNTSVQKFMREIIVGATTNDWELKSTEVRFVDGSTLRNDYTNAVPNRPAGDLQLDWPIPANFEVSKPMEQK